MYTGICENLITVWDTRLFYVVRDKNVPRISILTIRSSRDSLKSQDLLPENFIRK